MLNPVEKSKILDHSLNSGHCTSENNFKILDSCQPFDLRILESIYIYIYIYRRFNAIVSQLKMHYFSGGAFESLISSQLLKKEKYI